MTPGRQRPPIYTCLCKFGSIPIHRHPCFPHGAWGRDHGRPHYTTSFSVNLKAVALHSLEAAIFISFCVLPSVTRSLFLAFQCESFGFDDATSETKSYLTASLDIECTGPAHQPIIALAAGFIVVWPLAMAHAAAVCTQSSCIAAVSPSKTTSPPRSRVPFGSSGATTRTATTAVRDGLADQYAVVREDDAVSVSTVFAALVAAHHTSCA